MAKRGRKPGNPGGGAGARLGGELTERDRRIVEAFMGEAEGVATQVSRITGIPITTVHRRLKKDQVINAIRKRQAGDKLVASRQARQQFWTETMLNPDADMAHRLKASELLGKSQADFIERREVIAKIGQASPEELSDAQLVQVIEKTGDTKLLEEAKRVAGVIDAELQVSEDDDSGSPG